MAELGTLVFWVVVISTAIVTFIWLPLSILWAPFAAFISARQARTQGSEIWWQYGLLGALYSVSFLLPWIYLAWRLSQRRMPISLIMTGYISIYILWLLSLFFTFSFLTTESQVVALLALFVGVAFGILSTFVLLRNVSRDRFRDQLQPFSKFHEEPFRDLPYIAPFILAFVQMIILNWAIRYSVLS